MSMYECENCGSDYCSYAKILLLDFEALNTSGEELGHEVHVELKHKPKDIYNPKKLGEYFDLFHKKVGEKVVHLCSKECAIEYLNTDHRKVSYVIFITDLEDNDAIFKCPECERKFVDKNLPITNGFICPHCHTILYKGNY